MVSTVNKKIIEMILNREMKVTDFNFEEPLNTWHDAFILELLKWFDKKINDIPVRKHDLRDKDWLEHWTSYYEQYVRILYYFVVYKNIQDSDDLKMIFVYLFPVDKDDNPYRNDSDMISAEKLIKVYKYLIMYTPDLKKDNKERECLDNVLIGRWNNEKMKNKLDYINDESYKKKNTENDEIILKFFKRIFSELDINKINDVNIKDSLNENTEIDFNIKDSLENTENDEMLLEILKETFSEIDLKKIVEFYNTL